jgi:tetratricopeptide (TPR) repeat protein
MIKYDMGALMNRSLMKFFILACAALTIGSCWAQKPKSPKEQEALVAVSNAKTPDETVAAIENVLTKFADTEYKTVLLQMAMQAESQKGDYVQTVFYAERLLESDPKNAPAMVTLASETARHTREFDLDKEEKLTKADKYAKSAIEAAKTMPKGRPDLTDEQWEGIRKDIQAQAYEAMGMAASLRKKLDDAIADYKQASDVAATKDPTTEVRLGQAYLDAGKLDEANAAFDKALGMPNLLPQVKQVAQDKKAEVAKKKAAGGAK